MQTVVKKWFKEREYGFLENGTGPDIMVRKADLIRCHFLKVGATVEFECHPDKSGLIAKKVKLVRKNQGGDVSDNAREKRSRRPFIGVMT